jgi:hypothetical protein
VTTKAERMWMDDATRLGCIVCRLHRGVYMTAMIHHILRGGRRIDHLHTLPLCYAHHSAGVRTAEFVSRHPWHREFERRYGTEYELLEKTRELIAAASTGAQHAPRDACETGLCAGSPAPVQG